MERYVFKLLHGYVELTAVGRIVKVKYRYINPLVTSVGSEFFIDNIEGAAQYFDEKIRELSWVELSIYGYSNCTVERREQA